MYDINIVESVFNSNETQKINYYKLDDGRIWSISKAMFVSSVPNEAIVGSCPDEHGGATIEGLIGCLDFYGYPKGELETEQDRAKIEIAELEEWLKAHDYIGTKIATGRATQEDYATEIAQMTAKAARIEELRAVLAE